MCQIKEAVRWREAYGWPLNPWKQSFTRPAASFPTLLHPSPLQTRISGHPNELHSHSTSYSSLINLSKQVSHGRCSQKRFQALTSLTLAAKAILAPQEGATNISVHSRWAVRSWPWPWTASLSEQQSKFNQGLVFSLDVHRHEIFH